MEVTIKVRGAGGIGRIPDTGVRADWVTVAWVCGLCPFERGSKKKATAAIYGRGRRNAAVAVLTEGV